MMKDESRSANEGQNLIAFCGLYCGACSFRVAAQENDRRHLRDMPARYDQYKDAPMDICPGCRQESRDGPCAWSDAGEAGGRWPVAGQGDHPGTGLNDFGQPRRTGRCGLSLKWLWHRACITAGHETDRNQTNHGPEARRR
jgi:hypothetical protein